MLFTSLHSFHCLTRLYDNPECSSCWGGVSVFVPLTYCLHVHVSPDTDPVTGV